MFIVLESTEGAGKGTLRNALEILANEKNKDWVFTREPGGCHVSEQLRELILRTDNHFETSDEILLLTIARYHHLKEVIKPALEAGKVVICERWIPTTIAYQAYGRTFDLPNGNQEFIKYLSLILEMTKYYKINETQVDLAILLDIDPVIGLERIRSRSALDRIELSPPEFFHAVREGYHAVLLEGKHCSVNNVRVINAEQSIEEVRQHAFNIFKEFDLI